MGFLKKFGQIILKFTEIAVGVGGSVAAQIPGTKDDAMLARATDTLTEVARLVGLAEVFGQVSNLDGAAKLQAVAPTVAQIVLRSDLMIGRKIKDPVKFQQGVTNIAGGVADILNSLEDSVDTIDKAS